MNPSAVYLSIDNVVPIDPEKAGKTVADYLNDFGQITFFSLIGLAVLSLILAIVIAKKAGFSGWWGAVGVLFPPLGVVLALLFALVKWPALKQRDEALGILTANDLTLPSQERKAIKEAERKQSIEDEARKRMEKAQAAREKADAERAKFAASEAKRAADASTVAAAASAASITAAANKPEGGKDSDVKEVPAPKHADAAPVNPPAPKAEPAVEPVKAADEAAEPRTEAPGSVAPKVRTARPRTTTDDATGSAPTSPPPPPEA